MKHWLQQLDDILRGEATSQKQLDGGQLEMAVGGLGVMVLVLGAASGLCTGSFAMFRALWTDIGTTHDGAMQLVASAVKLPLLFVLTLLVTLPSLYVFSALAGSRLSFSSVWRLLLAMLGVMLAVLASLGPIIVFFGASTESYPFMKLLNVAAATVAGCLGLTFLLRTLHRLISSHESAARAEWLAALASSQEPSDATPSSPVPSHVDQEKPAEPRPTDASEGEIKPPVVVKPPQGALDRTGPTTDRARAVFQMWVVVFAVVGAQMSWVLRPFVGSPNAPFSWFRTRESNFFMDVLRAISALFGS